MRLKCPNCEAQYEVSDSVIPLHGRDVQCSNCGQTWFQTHPQAEPETAAEDGDEDAEFGGEDSLPNVAAGAWDPLDADEDVAEPEVATTPAEPSDAPLADVSAESTQGLDDAAPTANGPAPTAMSDAGPEALVAPSSAMEPTPGAAPAVASAEPPQDPPDPADDFAETTPGMNAETVASMAGGVASPALEPKRRSLDEAVLSVLREEAEREAKARRAAGGLETQTDLNLSVAETPARGTSGLDSLPRLRVQPQAESHVADLSTGGPRRPVEDLSSPVEAETADLPTAQRQSRRGLLPDIEEFSSSLQANGGKTAAAAAAIETRPTRRSGFRTGFLLVILLAALMFGLYAAAPALGSRFPAALPALNQFVATVDKGRVMVDQLMQSSLDRLKGDEKPVE